MASTKDKINFAFNQDNKFSNTGYQLSSCNNDQYLSQYPILITTQKQLQKIKSKQDKAEKVLKLRQKDLEERNKSQAFHYSKINDVELLDMEDSIQKMIKSTMRIKKSIRQSKTILKSNISLNTINLKSLPAFNQKQ